MALQVRDRKATLLGAAIACLILLLACSLRLWKIESESLDGDELFSLRVATADTRTALGMVENDFVHPPLYYFVLKAALPLTGMGPTRVRLVSLIAGIGSIGIFLLWGAAVPALRLSTIISGILLASNNDHIFCSQQTRSYALYCALVCLLILWMMVLESHHMRRLYWLAGVGLMTAVLYTHYVGLLFIAAAVLSTLVSPVSWRIRTRMIFAVTTALLLFVPWLGKEVARYLSDRGLADPVSWQGLPTEYDLRSVWAGFLGFPQFRGAAILAVCITVVTIGLGVYLNGRAKQPITRYMIAVLLSTAFLPASILFAMRFRPVGWGVFGQRHILPSIFPTLALVSLGLVLLVSMLPGGRVALALVTIGLCALEMLQSFGASPRRHPYSVIAARIRDSIERTRPIYTTWPYGIGYPVNYYLGREVVRPLPMVDGTSELPNRFVILYRPAIPNEARQAAHLMQSLPNASSDCEYYSSVTAPGYGTRLCSVRWYKPGNLAVPAVNYAGN